MTNPAFRPFSPLLLLGLLLVFVPAMSHGQVGETPLAPPANGGLQPAQAQTQTGETVAAPLVREGDLAAQLERALGVGTGEDEAEAETRLGGLGIAPRNGWIADYPVTPDILGELQGAVAVAADSGRLPIGRDEALQRLSSIAGQMGVAFAPYNAGGQIAQPAYPYDYASPEQLNGYYTTEGPPVVTYYAPPLDYYYLYSWVPYPFWYGGFAFPGFFVLRDFHRVVVVGGRPFFVSNHFNDVRAHRVFRVDPVRRFEGRTFAGIGAPHGRAYIATGTPRSARTVFNAPRTFGPGARTAFPASRMGGAPPPPAFRGGVSGHGGNAGGFGGHSGGSGHGGGVGHSGGR